MKDLSHGFITEDGNLIDSYNDFIEYLKTDLGTNAKDRSDLIAYAILLGAIKNKDLEVSKFLDNMNSILQSLSKLSPSSNELIAKFRLLISLYMFKEVDEIVKRISTEVHNEINSK